MSEWIKWEGGDCPVHENAWIDYRLRSGLVFKGYNAAGLYWHHEGDGSDILAYRLSEQQSMEEAYEETMRGIQDVYKDGTGYQTKSDHRKVNDSALDVQVGGDHYKKCGIQPITYIHANKIGFMEGNAIKYLSRWRDKGGVDDLKKAKHYIEMLIELEGK